jgi:spore maturation protein CgeB
MERLLRALVADPAMRAEIAAAGRETILARHTCAHRVDELLGIVARLNGRQELEAAE